MKYKRKTKNDKYQYQDRGKDLLLYMCVIEHNTTFYLTQTHMFRPRVLSFWYTFSVEFVGPTSVKSYQRSVPSYILLSNLPFSFLLTIHFYMSFLSVDDRYYNLYVFFISSDSFTTKKPSFVFKTDFSS